MNRTTAGNLVLPGRGPLEPAGARHQERGTMPDSTMATSITGERSAGPMTGRADAAAIAEMLGSPSATPAVGSGRRRFPLGLALLFAAVAGAAAAYPWLAGILFDRAGSAALEALPTTVVRRGELMISVTEEGSLVSDENVDIVCGVAGGATIVWLIDDGARVTEGTEIVRLDDSTLAENATAQRIAFEKARAAMIQAEKDHAAGTIAVEEYKEGTFKKELRMAESSVTAATERLQATRNTLAYGERMFRKGYIAAQQLEAQKSAVARAELDLGTAEIALDALTRFTKPKMITELESVRDAAAARLASEQAALELEQVKLDRLNAQLSKCVVMAPKDGLVIYANERNRDRESEVKAGAMVSEGKTILRLPNLSKMRADVEVHESKVDRIRPGMPATIRVQGRSFTGEVTTVANRPQSNWLSTAKKYVVEVRIDGNTEALRPGFTAEVEIIVADLQDVIAVPVAAVIEQLGEYVAAVRQGDQIERRLVTIGQSNDKLVEILAGLDEGETLVLNPRGLLPDAPPPDHSATQPADAA
jgi:HlyD family secretion protein